MTSKTGSHPKVLRYAYLIIVSIAGAAIALFASIYVRHASETVARDQLERFHLRSIMLIDESLTRVSAVQRELLETESDDVFGRDREIALRVENVGRNLETLIGLQQRWGVADFDGAVERVDARYGRLRQLLDDGDWTTTQLLTELGALDFSLFQLDRLHSIASEQMLSRITIRSRRGALGLIVVSVVVLLVAGILVARALHLLKSSLHEYQRIQEALVESERQIQHASKMQALGTLVGGVAHDFNNILTAILGYSEALDTRLRSDDSARVMVGEIRKAGKRAATLTRHLLAFGRQESVELRVVDVNVTLRELEPMLRRLIREDIDLVVRCAADPCPAEVDVAQFEQVMVNLAVNARDAMPRGGTLTFRTESLEVVEKDPRMSGGPYIRITVEDTGCGMDPAVRARVFEPFFTTKAPDRGTGLGLSTVHGIVTKSRGFIFVESETGTGSTFDIFLPRYDEPAEAGRTEEPIAGSMAGTETVLVVEDEAPVRDVVTASLRSAGYEVLSARDGMEALRICADRDASIDLLLTDVVMPTLGGPELARRARELCPRLRVVYLTGYIDEIALEDLRDTDAPVVSKPFQMQELLSVVRQTLDERRDDRTNSNLGA